MPRLRDGRPWVPATPASASATPIPARGPTKDHPLTLFFTSAGQIAGVGVTVWGTSWTSWVGAAAQPQLIQDGFWRTVSGTTDAWHIFVSFRSADLMCSGKTGAEAVGDRLVINQDTIKVSIPIVQADAVKAGYTPGSCINSMGQHMPYDLATAPTPSFVEGNLMPVVPMYWNGRINAIFVTSPVVQKGNLSLRGRGDFDFPFVTAGLMCLNWCDSRCSWAKTNLFATMHIFLNSQFKTLKCANADWLGRSCPNGKVTSTAPRATNVRHTMPPEGAQ